MGDRLLVHPLCPYAQRALYALAYKGLETITVEEVDLVRKPKDLLRANPCGLVPTLIRSEGSPVTESLVIVDYLDTLPGPAMYPRLQSGGVDQQAKRKLTDMIQSLSSDFGTYWTYFGVPSVRNARLMTDIAVHIDSLLPNGCYFAEQIIGQNVLTAVDITVYPFVERIAIISDSQGLILDRTPNLRLWFQQLSTQPWIQRYRADPRRLQHLVDISARGDYIGLELPASRYD